MDLHTKTIDIKGIGPKTVKLYEKLGLNEAEDFLYYYPRDYMTYEETIIPSENVIGNTGFFEGIITRQPLLRRAGRLQIVSASILCSDIEVKCVWFHMPYLTKSLKAGSKYVFRGRLDKKGNNYYLEQPLILTLDNYYRVVNTLQPIYSLTKGLSNQALLKVIRLIFDTVPIPDDKLMSGNDHSENYSKKDALYDIHFPKDTETLIRARKRLVYDEFFLFMLKMRMLKEENANNPNNFEIYPSANTKRIIERLPYKLTNAQNRVWEEVSDDLCGKYSMNRLVQGDVGSGKTIIAALAAVMVSDSGYQSVIMAPTEILAAQHFENITELLKENHIETNVVLLTGSLKTADKREALSKIESGEAKIIIGTHALFQEKVLYDNLALVVTDEQHRFGVRQRESLSNKNSAGPHVLVMSATPIPRTLAIILYGDLDVSVIDEVPARRLPIKNCVVNTDYRETAYKFIARQIEMGHQAYVICPLVEESEGLDCENVIDYTEKLREYYGTSSGIQIGYLHGKMRSNEKNSVMDAFYKNEINILVSTTVVEVGVNVPNATVMLVENSERFGLSQLHQLRGRIGRSSVQSYCIFMSSSRSDATKKRLEILNKSNDGFYIAGEDLKLRGPGDMFGFRQSGDIQFALGDIFRDADVLKEASDALNELLEKDPDLGLPENSALRAYISERGEECFRTVL